MDTKVEREAEGREDEVRKSEATNIKSSLIANIVSRFQDVKVNLNAYDLVFITIHPYKKHKQFDKHQILSKVSDKIRKRMGPYVMTREANKIKGHHHYHVLGYLPKDKNIQMRGFKIWSRRVGSLATPRFTSVKQIHDEFYADDENVENDYYLTKVFTQINEGKACGLAYWKQKKSNKDHTHDIIRYMFKTFDDYPLLYQDYILVKC